VIVRLAAAAPRAEQKRGGPPTCLVRDVAARQQVARPDFKMPGSSRMPISLRDSFNSVKRKTPASPLLILNLDL